MALDKPVKPDLALTGVMMLIALLCYAVIKALPSFDFQQVCQARSCYSMYANLDCPTLLSLLLCQHASAHCFNFALEHAGHTTCVCEPVAGPSTCVCEPVGLPFMLLWRPAGDVQK